jgi:hypothetical protein
MASLAGTRVALVGGFGGFRDLDGTLKLRAAPRPDGKPLGRPAGNSAHPSDTVAAAA